MIVAVIHVNKGGDGRDGRAWERGEVGFVGKWEGLGKWRKLGLQSMKRT